MVLEQGRALASGPLSETLARLDLPIRLGEDAGVVLEGEIAELDAEWHLARVAFAGGSLWVRDNKLPIGQHVRVRIRARDITSPWTHIPTAASSTFSLPPSSNWWATPIRRWL